MIKQFLNKALFARLVSLLVLVACFGYVYTSEKHNQVDPVAIDRVGEPLIRYFASKQPRKLLIFDRNVCLLSVAPVEVRVQRRIFKLENFDPKTWNYDVVSTATTLPDVKYSKTPGCMNHRFVVNVGTVEEKGTYLYQPTGIYTYGISVQVKKFPGVVFVIE